MNALLEKPMLTWNLPESAEQQAAKSATSGIIRASTVAVWCSILRGVIGVGSPTVFQFGRGTPSEWRPVMPGALP